MPSDAFWEDLWKRESAFMAAARPEFRHGVSFVGVSDIAGQFYCEYKVENAVAMGEIPTETKETGTRLHDELVPGVSITPKAFAKLVSRKVPSYAVLGVWGSVGGLRIIGMPDHIVWAGGKPLWLVELKTTKGDPGRLWDDQAVQARIYGLLLYTMGLDCSELRLAVVRVKADELSEDEKKRWVRKVSGALMGGKVARLESEYRGAVKVHVMAHDVPAALASIGSKRGYWTGEREPTSSTSAAKCRACEYCQVCDRSLARTPS